MCNDRVQHRHRLLPPGLLTRPALPCTVGRSGSAVKSREQTWGSPDGGYIFWASPWTPEPSGTAQPWGLPGTPRGRAFKGPLRGLQSPWRTHGPKASPWTPEPLTDGAAPRTVCEPSSPAQTNTHVSPRVSTGAPRVGRQTPGGSSTARLRAAPTWSQLTRPSAGPATG